MARRRALLALCLACALVACGSSRDPEDSPGDGEGAGFVDEGEVTRRKIYPTGDNQWPLEVQVMKTRRLAAGVGRHLRCLNAEVEIEVDCEEARTCGCKSSNITVRVNEDREVLSSRLDEIADVFNADVLHLNLTLCNVDLEAHTAEDDAKAVFYTIEVELTHQRHAMVNAYACSNVSASGASEQCTTRGKRRDGDDESLSPKVTVEAVTYSQDHETCSEDGVCRKGAKGGSVEEADRLLLGGKAREAWHLLRQASHHQDPLIRREALSRRLALLPRHALAGRCCDSANTRCADVPLKHKSASRTGAEQGIQALFGANQCEGIFLEIGAGNGVSDSASLFFEKMMGWTGLLVEASDDDFALLEASGRDCQKLHASVKGSRGRDGLRAVDVRAEIERLRPPMEGQGVNLLVINAAEDETMRVVEELNLTASRDYMGMLSPAATVVAVSHWKSTENGVTELLRSRSYDFSRRAGHRGADELSQGGKLYDVYIHMPAMETDGREEMEGEEWGRDGEEDWREPEIEFEDEDEDE